MASKSSIRPEEVTNVIRRALKAGEVQTEFESVGTVLEVGDGIARIYGVDECRAMELIEFPGDTVGIAMNLEEDNIGCVLMGGDENVSEGDKVRSTGRIADVPVGDALLGRVVDATGAPLDGRGPIDTEHRRTVERVAPGIIRREPVSKSLASGYKIVDALTPIGRGQRELIIGDRQTGKTALCVDAILAQKDTDVICIYVAIGQKMASIAQTINLLEREGLMEKTVIVAATATLPAPQWYLAPFSGCAIGEDFMERGKHVLIIYDDLTRHADAYREISLLLRRPPGREAYPGDIFYLHSRLLERAMKYSKGKLCPACGYQTALPSDAEDLGDIEDARVCSTCGADTSEQPVVDGGSLTALPVVETKAGDISTYIPTNLISITDGQIFLETNAFHKGIRPAMNVGTSVSRVGSAAQTKAMKSVAGELKLSLAQYREMAAFAEFGTDLDEATQRQLARGERMTEVLKQGQFAPMPFQFQVIDIYLGTADHLADVAVKDVTRFEREFQSWLRANAPEIAQTIGDSGKFDEATAEQLDKAVADFAGTFVPSETTDTAEADED